MNVGNSSFSGVLRRVGTKPSNSGSQDELRHYSETFSKEVALWLRDAVCKRFPKLTVLLPEGKVDTVFGRGRHGKSLDVAALESNGYLVLDISIKTFNFRDRKSKNYRHNFTGRFYELLGEELDIRKSYEHSILVAIILLPNDAAEQLSPSCFARCVKQFSKAARSPSDAVPFGFELIYVGIHSPNGDIYFFDVTNPPPKTGHAKESSRASLDIVLSNIERIYTARKQNLKKAPLPTTIEFEYE